MVKWNKALSWSKVKMMLSCPRKLQYTLEQKPVGVPSPSYYRNLGSIAQYVLEIYFNQRVNLKSGGTEAEVIQKVITKVLNSKLVQTMDITYPPGKSRVDFDSEVRRHVTMGTEILRARGMLGREIDSEVKGVGELRGTRAYMQIDFVVKEGKYVSVLDGKGTMKTGEDSRQLKMYAAIMMKRGVLIKEAAFVYWNVGEYEAVDVSPESIKKFLDSDWVEAQKIAALIGVGVDTLDARPSHTECWKCDWKTSCPESMFRPVTNDRLLDEVGFQ